MKVHMFTVGLLSTNCYVAYCEKTGEAIVVDPGFDTPREANQIQAFIQKENLQTRYIVNTHGHVDHTSGNGILKKLTNAPIIIHEKDASMLGETGQKLAQAFGIKSYSPKADKQLRDGDIIRFGEEHLTVAHTPGHSPGGISLIGKDVVFTGDTLFAGSVGRVDFPGGSAKALLKSLRERIMTLPEHFTVYPGHGPATTIGAEKQSNPFLLDPTLLGE